MSFRKAGFTLLELVVVIFILSLVVGLAIPSFYVIGEGRLKSEAVKMASILRNLNETAVARKETVPLKINLDTKTVSWDVSGGGSAERFDYISKVSLTSRGDVSEGEVILFFSPLGLKEDLRITLKEGSKEMLIAFNPLSGRVKIIQNPK